jgi:hypothetical protein
MATKTIIPRGSGEGGLGIESVSWGQAYFDYGNFNELQVNGRDVLISGDSIDYQVTQQDVTTHESAITISESQISDLGSYLTSADLDPYVTSGNLDGFHQKTDDGGLTVTGQLNLSGHIIPTENAQFDLGSAEKKIRHLYLSSNSMFIGEQSISIDQENNLVLPSSIKIGGNDGIVLSKTEDGKLQLPSEVVREVGDGSIELIDGGYF